ncbi:NLP/P60 family protein [Mycobacteroides abscessus subsp. abscessus]|uniref:DUF4226 domain-containing protein n=1 Tax=Mycobacteroides abscessus TaxID=36809 RepID=UPI0009A7EBAA|nr:DUF4226 domain-containing protein [Mycobacteroides abscessus]SKO35040.1 NLP/P60 family protein [Mycobacteroides abscessus subsp. abscessus]
MTNWDESIELLQRGHEAFGAPATNAPVPPTGGQAIADSSSPAAERARASAERLYKAAQNDESLMRLLRQVAATHRQGQQATRLVLDAARADRGPAADTPMGQREQARRMAGYLRDQHGHLVRSRAQARAYAAALRKLKYRRALRTGRRELPGLAQPSAYGRLTARSGRREIAAAILWEARRRGYDKDQAIACLSTALQESGLRPHASGGGGAWIGIYQQDTGYPGRADPNRNIAEFFNRLDAKGGPSSPDIWKTIFWLQQAPGMPSAAAAYATGRRAYLTEIQSQLGTARQLYQEIAA